MLADTMKKPIALALALMLVAASLVPLLTARKAHAYALISARSIKLSSSKASDTDVTYSVSFNPGSNGSVGGMVVDVCSNSPIIGDSCTGPTGFKFHAKSGDNTLAVANQSGLSGNNFSVDVAGAADDDNTAVFSRTAGALSTGTQVTIDLGSSGGSDGVDNPTGGTPGVAPENNITFYARILTFDTAAHAEAYTSTAAGGGTGAVDAGGVALSTANQLTVTAKVQERLTFCVYTSGTACANGIGNSITLGDVNGVLDNNTEYTNNTAKFGVATNANGLGANSVSIRLKGGTLKNTPGCADGTAHNCSIDPVGNTETDTASGTEYFGLCVSPSASPLVAASPYSGNAAANCDVTGSGNNGTNKYGFDDNNTTGTQSTYGQSIATFNAATEKTGTLDFVGDIGATTEPGIYTTTLTFIATGTY